MWCGLLSVACTSLYLGFQCWGRGSLKSASVVSGSSLCFFFRPAWDESTTAEELGQRERDSFVEWRRQLAK